jgi:Domain of unknown function (DUF4157)
LEKATANAVDSRATPNRPLPAAHPVPGAFEHPFAGLQRTIGNQAVLRLMESGGLQTKLRVSQPGDADEQEADRAAAQVVSQRSGPVLQRKCACGGTCSSCQEEKEDVIHRSALGGMPALRSFPFSIQRAAAAEDPSHKPAVAEESARQEQAKRPGERPHTVIVADDAPSLAPGQMRKTQFVALLQTTTCATADAVLASVNHTTKGCPYIKKWLDHYKDKDAQHLTRAMHKYAPETRQARSAHEAISLVNHRVHQATLSWAKTGKVSGLPAELQAELMGGAGGFLGAVAGFASSGFGSALLGFLGGGKKSESTEGGSVQRKARDGADAGPHDAETVKAQLGSGHSLDSRVQGQMSSAFGYDFSGVRVHTDSRSAGLSADLNARAFTVGSDVAFASGEYQPGTPIGDALIAHELAHVVQQGGGQQPAAPMRKSSEGSNGQLEEDADRSAVGAVATIWAEPRRGLASVAHNAIPRLRSGLKLQTCKSHDLEIRDVSSATDPKSIFFDRNSSKIDSTQKPKIPPLKNPRSQALTLFSFVSEDENVPVASGHKLADERATSVSDALRKDPGGHLGVETPVLDTTSGQGQIDYRSMRKVIVKPAGQPSGQPSCAAGAQIPCSPTTKFTDAQGRADTLLTAAITALGPPVSPAAVPLLDARFGATAATRNAIATAVKANLVNLQTHISGQMAADGAAGPPVVPGHRCANACDSACSAGDTAYNSDTDADALMTLCDTPRGFMQVADLNERAATLIHEGLHGITLAAVPGIIPSTTPGTTDFAYHEQRLINFLDPATALNNTDSYVLLVQKLNGQAVTIGPSVPDPATGVPLSPGPGGERAEVDRAVAWLEGWMIWAEQETDALYDTINESIRAGAWSNDYYKKTMELLAPLFNLTAPPALPLAKDKFAVAAIHDRFAKMSDVLFSVDSLAIERKSSGTTSWASGPTRHLTIGPDFFSLPAGPTKLRAQIHLLLRKMLEANPDISTGFRPRYEVLTERIRLHHGGGPA